MVRLVEEAREARLQRAEHAPEVRSRDLAPFEAVPEREHAIELRDGPGAEPAGRTTPCRRRLNVDPLVTIEI